MTEKRQTPQALKGLAAFASGTPGQTLTGGLPLRSMAYHVIHGSDVGEYDITADELLSGAGGNTATKTEQAERLILDLLADGKELASEDIVKAAAEAGISERTVQNAKRNMGGILGARRVGGQWYNFIKKKQPPEPAS